ncbi:CHAT domain-containing tetratricopeptide repeat protein [Rivularia sp. UHCC 0363]|uniref:CHAT domain-containing tetratricopeptide repeat protein n=1 Tax=Rivularia sp. UHCC 0363 TaxID=3110244 RepID=UPI002B1EBDC8|nr:tetratricopeptide repeat protein [Rivularia sp. UHCC 0363]MEA5594721.1 tetratricopeptide repeat protein [Rivularia sp. UHCC 0363]
MSKLGIKKAIIFIGILFGTCFSWAVIQKIAIAEVNSFTSKTQSEELAEAEKLNQRVVQLYQEGKYNEAIPLAERALAIAQKILGEHPDVATSLNNLAGLYKVQGRYSEAELFYKKALEIRKRILGNEHPYVTDSLNGLATLYHYQGRYPEVEPLYKQILEMRKRILGNEHPDVATSLNNLAELYRNQGRYSEAELFYKQALEMRKRIFGKEHPYVTDSLNGLAILYHYQGRYSEVEPLYKQVLEMRKRILGNEHPDVAASLNNLAGLYVNQGRYSEAELFYKQALEMRKRILGNEHPDVATSLNGLAILYHYQGRYSEVEPLYKQILEMRKRILGNEHPDVAASLNNLALLYLNQGRYLEAELFYKQALEMRKRILGKEHPDVAASLNDLAGLYEKQGRYSEAKPFYKQALEMRKRILGNEHLDVANSLNNLALLDLSQGRYSEVESLFKQALEMRKRLLGNEHADVATILNNLAGLYVNQGRYSEAEPFYKQVLEMIKHVLGNKHPYVAASLNNLAGLYVNQGRYSEAESFYKQALEMRKHILGNEHPDVAASLNDLAVLYQKQGNITNALEFLKQGLEVEEENLAINLSGGFERQKRDYMATISGTTNATISLHLNSAPKNPKLANLALTTIFQRKGRILDVLTNNLQILRQHTNDKDSLKLIDELSDIYNQLASLIYNRPEKFPPEEYRQQVADLEEKVKRKEDDLSRRSAEFANSSKPVNLENIQKLIPADAALVEIVRYQPFNPKAKQNQRFGKPRYAAYILTSTDKQPNAIDLGEAKEIEKPLELFRKSLQGTKNAEPSTSIPELKESARDLDKLVMQPIRKLLGNKRKILISPDASLNLIPFEALVDENNRYLVENYSFTYLTSGRDLLRLQNQYPSKQPPVIMADPFFDKQGEVVAIKPKNTRSIDLSKIKFPPLNGTRKEAEAISQILGVKPLLGTQASEAVIKQLKSPELLLIATHGFFENAPKTENENNKNQNAIPTNTFEDNPLLLSGLVLAGYKNNQGGGNQDGILTALETTSLNLLGTKLVVLSACDTGLGKDTTGEGIYGLRRALVIAGSESQVISLWKVADDATKDLMVAYFKKVLGKGEKKQGRSEALRQVQLEMLQGDKYQHPYYWAAFIPSGDWREMP